MLMSWLMKRKSSSRRSSRGWHQKPFHATGQGGRSTDGQKDASAQPGLAPPQLQGTNEHDTAETGGQSTVLWYSPLGLDGAVRTLDGTVSNVSAFVQPTNTPCRWPLAAGCSAAGEMGRPARVGDELLPLRRTSPRAPYSSTAALKASTFESRKLQTLQSCLYCFD